MIELQKIQCSFDNKVILDEVSLYIENHMSILGANGSGKSTLAKIICGLIECEGVVNIDDANIKTFSPKEKAKVISYIPAKLEMYDSFMSVKEFVLLGRFPYKRSFFNYSLKDKKIATECLKFLNIAHLALEKIGSLSSGETQLALIAQALAQQSKIIIFDEPTANLDPKNSKIIAEHIKGLKEYHQVILITHDLHLAAFVDSPVAFIKEKKLHYFEVGFFEAQNLEELYGVAFDALVVQYD